MCAIYIETFTHEWYVVTEYSRVFLYFAHDLWIRDFLVRRALRRRDRPPVCKLLVFLRHDSQHWWNRAV